MAASGLGLNGTTDGPALWPDPPTEMTVTTLVEIESCPRRWALSVAYYPEIWERRGYPPRLHLGKVAGTVVHRAIETITKGLVSAGCASVQDPAAFKVMKRLGGYTNIINECIDGVLFRFTDNPRAQRLLEFAARSLRARAPELRFRTQTMLSRVRLSPTAVPQARGSSSKKRGPLTIGVFPEVEFRAKQIQWKGRADLLVLSPDVCEITDFKTGPPNETHELQIQVYALLWSRDKDLNPTRRLADRLVLAYEGDEVEVATPGDTELEVIEESIVTRGNASREAVYQSPPEARSGPDHCPYCGVRQLCSEYWTPRTQRKMAEPGGDERFGDIELTLTGRHGPSSWDARVQLSRNLPSGMTAVLQTSENIELQFGARLRVLDAAIAVDAEDQDWPAVITLRAMSEVYVVTKA